MTCIKISNGIVCIGREFKPGDLPPKEPCGYNDKFEWAEVQYKAGLRQKRCGQCGTLAFPQQMSEQTIDSKYSKTKYGPQITKKEPICKKCELQNNGESSDL